MARDLFGVVILFGLRSKIASISAFQLLCEDDAGDGAECTATTDGTPVVVACTVGVAVGEGMASTSWSTFDTPTACSMSSSVISIISSLRNWSSSILSNETTGGSGVSSLVPWVA